MRLYYEFSDLYSALSLIGNQILRKIYQLLAPCRKSERPSPSRDGSFGGEQIVGESDLLPDAQRRERPLDGDLDRPVPKPHLTAGQLPCLQARSGQVRGHSRAASGPAGQVRSEVTGGPRAARNSRAASWPAGQVRPGEVTQSLGRTPKPDSFSACSMSMRRRIGLLKTSTLVGIRPPLLWSRECWQCETCHIVGT